MTICILGRQPALGLAELESLYGADEVRPVGDGFALVDADVDFTRLGGSVKAAKHLTTLDTTKAPKLFDYCRTELPKHLHYLPEGKLKLGVSLYGIDLPISKLNAMALGLKKAVREAGRSVRVVPNTEPALSSAQTYHNQLTGPLGMELVFICDGNKTLLGQVTHVQDIDAYRRRDQERPRRDAYVGMLPPKLAQTIVNLASGRWKMEDGKNSHIPIANSQLPTLLDPFCGTGVVLQEAALMGYGVYGTDVDERMVRYSRDNLNWLKLVGGKWNMVDGESQKKTLESDFYLEIADATDHTWRPPIDFVACEGYLGHPFANEPDRKALDETVQTCDVIMKKFLKNIHSQIKPGTRLCIAAPAWHTKGQVRHLPVIERLGELGFERVSFKHVRNDDLVYRREGQVVGRELLVLVRR